MEKFDPCSTTRTLLTLSSLCECFPLVYKDGLLILAGGSNENAAFGMVFGRGNEYGEVGPRSKIDMLSGLREGTAPLPASRSSNSTSERLPASMSVSTRLLERIFRKNAMSAFFVLAQLIFDDGFAQLCSCHGSDNK